jgi:hypothetical protein
LTKDDDHITEGVGQGVPDNAGAEKLHSVHGWRASLSTGEGSRLFRRLCGLLLDHVSDNQVARAYDRGERLLDADD